MSLTEQQDFESFLSTFNATDLGHGDPAAGANLLAAMACTLADLAHDDGTVVTSNGQPVKALTHRQRAIERSVDPRRSLEPLQRKLETF